MKSDLPLSTLRLKRPWGRGRLDEGVQLPAQDGCQPPVRPGAEPSQRPEGPEASQKKKQSVEGEEWHE